MLRTADFTATAEQLTYMATLAQVIPVLILAIALESRIIQWIGGALAGTMVFIGILGELFALVWMGGVSYSAGNPLVVDALPTFRILAESACFLMLALFLVFAGTELVRAKRRGPETSEA